MAQWPDMIWDPLQYKIHISRHMALYYRDKTAMKGLIFTMGIPVLVRRQRDIATTQGVPSNVYKYRLPVKLPMCRDDTVATLVCKINAKASYVVTFPGLPWQGLNQLFRMVSHPYYIPWNMLLFYDFMLHIYPVYIGFLHRHWAYWKSYYPITSEMTHQWQMG